MEAQVMEEAECTVCRKRMRKPYLNQHLFSAHGLSKQQIKEMSYSERVQKVGSSFQCTNCMVAYTSQKGLAAHLKQKHMMAAPPERIARKPPSIPCVYAACSKHFLKHWEMSTHCLEDHESALQGSRKVINVCGITETEKEVRKRFISITKSLKRYGFAQLFLRPVDKFLK